VRRQGTATKVGIGTGGGAWDSLLEGMKGCRDGGSGGADVAVDREFEQEGAEVAEVWMVECGWDGE
jgi:hypothetical protein